AILDAATNLKVIGRAGIGVDNVDIPAASAQGVIVMNTPFGNSITTAEHAIALMFALARQLPEADASTQAGKWEKNRFMGVELFGKTLGLIGAGNIGGIVADRANGLKMKVIAYDPFITDKFVYDNDGVKQILSVEELYAKADFLSLHIPSTPETKGSIGYEKLMSLPKGATLVNTARKEVIDEEGLKKALTERADLKYVTDIAPSNAAEMEELFGKRFFATPKKQGAETAEANINAGLAAARQIVAYFVDGENRFQVNK
ncbi:MAG: 3-phosphoglycerate dehydrogenase, partial [Alistipes sp.]|nr:3-phosphoglycerate dehydrogenase [Alistipes sp.]